MRSLFPGPEFPDVGRGIGRADGNGLGGIDHGTAAGADHEISTGFQSELYAFSGVLQSRVGPDTANELIGDLVFGQELTELAEQPASLNAPASVDKKRTASAVFADLLC